MDTMPSIPLKIIKLSQEWQTQKAMCVHIHTSIKSVKYVIVVLVEGGGEQDVWEND